MDATTAAALVDLTLPTFRLATIALILAVSLPLAAFLGFQIGARRRKRLLAEGVAVEPTVGEATTAALLAVLGLLLGFTFNSSLNAAETVKGAIVDEAAALGTAFGLADFLSEPGRTELKLALRNYAQTRVPPDQRIFSVEVAQAIIGRSLEAQAKLWPTMLEATRDAPAPIQALVGRAITDVLDAHLYRMATLAVPVAVFAQIFLLASALAALFLMGNRAGMIGRRLSWRTFVFIGFLGLLMYTIVDIRRGFDGLIRVRGTMLEATLYEMNQALEGRE